MSKKIVIGLIILVLIGIGVWLTRISQKEKPIGLEPVEKVEEVKLERKAAVGWSVKKDEIQAIQEAVAMMEERIEKTPDFAFLFSSIGYDEEKILREIRQLLPETKIYGGTGTLGPMTSDGFHGSEEQSVAILGIALEEIIWGVGGADLDQFSPKEAGKEAIKAAIENAGKEITEKPKIVFMTATPGNEEDILEGIGEVIGRNVPIFGGSSGDNELKGEWRQFVNDRVYSNGLSLAVAYTDLKVGYMYEAGYPVVAEQRGKVTRAEKRIIYEIDGRPAAKVYNQWTAGIFDKYIKEPGKVWGIIEEAGFYPIAKVLRAPGREPFYLAVYPLSIHSDYSLEVFADMKAGDEIVLLQGNWEILLNRFRTTPAKALEQFGIEKEKPLFALYTFCAGTLLLIPETERAKMPLLVKGEIGNVPFIGNFTLGEQGFVPGIGNHHGNLVNSIVIFSR